MCYAKWMVILIYICIFEGHSDIMSFNGQALHGFTKRIFHHQRVQLTESS